MYARIRGTGSYFPDKVLSNYDLSKIVETSDEWIIERTGISQRHISDSESTTDMAYNASLIAIEASKINRDEIDGIIFATFTPDYIMPTSAAMLQDKLGMKGQFAFDLNTACSSFLYALAVANGFIKSGMHKNILIAGAERLSSILDWKDRTTCILFGDGAGSVIVSADKEPGLLSINISADGSSGDLLNMRGMGSTFMSDRHNRNIEDELIKMNGSEIFKHAVRMMSESSLQAVEASGLKIKDIDFVLPHQANIRIMEAIAKRLDIDINKFILNIDRRGNTSSATIPTALDEAIVSGRVKKGDNILITAFGGGMSWGAGVITL